jgi:hypothetical protein
MMSKAPSVIKSTNFSHIWAHLFLNILDNPGKEVSNKVISLAGFENGIPNEDMVIREALDKCLLANGKQLVHTVANTIFPDSLWRISQHNRQVLFEKYIANLPRIKALEQRKNCRGLYFERLIAFGCGFANGNQLEHIISAYSKNPSVRRTMLQASIFDPNRDHTCSAQIGFPCLQHLQFIPDNKNKSLSVNALYATQQVFEKAYGNYLGICRLSQFMACEMGLSLDRVNFSIGVAKLDTISKTEEKIVQLKEQIKQALNSSSITTMTEARQD